MEIETIKANDKLKRFMDLVIEHNKSMNLTAITSIKDFYDKHFYDSLYVDNFLDLKNKKIMDLGSGAGFPGIPLAICYPKTKFYLVEPIKKRCNFLELVVKKLDLKNVIILNSRVENLDNEYHNFFDYVISRAVAKTNILLEICAIYTKIKGKIILYKGLKYKEEIDEAKNTFDVLKLKLIKVEKSILPFSKESRFYIIISKNMETPSLYPRPYSKVVKKPL